MVKFKSTESLKSLRQEILNSKSFLCFSAYKFINKKQVLKYIDEIYAFLPEDILEARKLLRANQCEIPHLNSCIHKILTDLETKLDKSVNFYGSYHIVNKKKCEEILQKLENNIPKEILKAENIGK